PGALEPRYATVAATTCLASTFQKQCCAELHSSVDIGWPGVTHFICHSRLVLLTPSSLCDWFSILPTWNPSFESSRGWLVPAGLLSSRRAIGVSGATSHSAETSGALEFAATVVVRWSRSWRESVWWSSRRLAHFSSRPGSIR